MVTATSSGAVIVAVTGGRDYAPNRADIAQLKAYWRILNGTELRVGDCPTGVDLWVRRNASHVLGVKPRVFVARWDLYGKPAGPIRNGWALDGTPDGQGEVVLAESLLSWTRVNPAREWLPPEGRVIIWDGTWQRRVLWDGSRFRSVRGWPGMTEPICWREDDPEWGKED